MTTTAVPARLTAQQMADYRQQGYIIYDKPIFPQPKFDALAHRFQEILDELPGDARPEAMDVPHFIYPDLFRWIGSDEVLDLVEPIIGPDIVLWASHFICKPRGNGKRVPWHEDSAYWKGRLDPMEVCTVWLAIDPSTRANGCMKVIPRTHATGRLGFSDYAPVPDQEKSVFETEILKPQRDDARAVYIELQPNHASLHDGRIQHGSDANTSEIRRCGYTIRFMPATVKMNKELCGKTHNLYLMRGRDRAGNDYADPTKSYPEIARFRQRTLKHSH